MDFLCQLGLAKWHSVLCVVCFGNLVVSIICMLSTRMKTHEPPKFPLHLPSCDT